MENSTTAQPVNSASIFLDPVTDDVRQVFQLINYFILCCVISLFGVGSNIVNMAVFVRQGFKDSINISLLGLAVSECAGCATTFGLSFFYNPFIENLGLPIVPEDFVTVATGWPHICVNRITTFITAFITLERCLCIAMPLKVKLVITPFRTKMIIIAMFVSVIAVFSPIFVVNKLEWIYIPSRNRTILSLTFTENREIVESITYFITSVFMSTSFFLCVIICTIILVVKLNKKTKWREASVAQTASKPETVSAKEKKVVKMIVLISTIYIVCNIPTTVVMFAMMIFPDFCVGGKFCQNILYVLWSFIFVLESFNSSGNIFVYFNMSTKYRTTFREIFSRLSKTGNDSAQIEIDS